MTTRILLLLMLFSASTFAQTPQIEPGVSQELAKWRAARYSDVRYKLNLTLEKMSPVLKGTIEIRVNVSPLPKGTSFGNGLSRESGPSMTPIVLDWRKIRGHEEKSTISNVTLNGAALSVSPSLTVGLAQPNAQVRASARAISGLAYEERDEHLIFSDGVEMGENVIKLDFTSPILTSGSAITRYVDKEDGSEYLYSLFVPSDASTAFPVFDQPDIKAGFSLSLAAPKSWKVVANETSELLMCGDNRHLYDYNCPNGKCKPGFVPPDILCQWGFPETKPISTYVFAFAAGPWERFEEPGTTQPPALVCQPGTTCDPLLKVTYNPRTNIYVRKSQAAKFKPHAAEVFRLNREAVKYFEEYFDYKFPWPKYDLVLIPEFPFGGMEHAGATFLRESSIIFPQEPTKNDHISRATLIFHEAAHQWFGDTVTMRWFDDLWLKEGFATFTAYKALEKIMPEMNAWKVFYERVKQAAYQTDSTKGTTPIYQEIPNLSAAKSAYGAIVYNKAPAFLRQAEYYLGEDKFQTAVRAFLKKHEFGNAGWEDLVSELGSSSKRDLNEWASAWVKEPGVSIFRGTRQGTDREESYRLVAGTTSGGTGVPGQKVNINAADVGGLTGSGWIGELGRTGGLFKTDNSTAFIFPNYGDYGYGIFLLDEKSREYVLKNIQDEKDPFLRSMMWGSLWDSVREGELDPREYVELVVKNLAQARASARAISGGDVPELDESTVQLLLGRVSVALNYYIPASDIALGDARANASDGLAARVEDMLIAGMQNSPTLGQRITYYRAFLNLAASENASGFLKAMLKASLETNKNVDRKPFPPGLYSSEDVGRIIRFEEMMKKLPLKTKDKFDIVTKLLILNDPEAPKLLAELEKTESSDDAKRYAYAARAGIATRENKAKYWKDFTENKEISESWIEAAFGPWNSIRHSELTLPYLERALKELPNHKRNRKIFFVNGWLGAFIGGQRSEEALAIVNRFLADNPALDNDLRLKILENVDVIERAVRIRKRFARE